MNKRDFAVVGLFHIPRTNIVFSMEKFFVNPVGGRHPRDEIKDIYGIIDLINKKSKKAPPGEKIPYGARCIAISCILDGKGKTIKDTPDTFLEEYCGSMDLYSLKHDRKKIEEALKQTDAKKWKLSN